MKVGLDAQLTIGSATGIGEYVSGLLIALRARGTSVVPLSAAKIDPWRFDRRVLWDQMLLPASAWRARVDVLHCAAGTLPLYARAPIVATVHDVAWLRVQGHARAYARWYFGTLQRALYRRAQRIIVDSAFSRDELLAASNVEAARIAVVHPGVAADFAGLERRPDDAAFALAVGTVERRKNLEVVIRSLADVPALQLISVGPATPYQDECVELARSCGVADRVKFSGYVARSELLDLYARAAVAVVPSRYEGFGYGAAQALCAGVPLIAADASSLPEVVGGGAPLCAPSDASAWSAALNAILADRAAGEAHAAGQRESARTRFSWTQAAEKTSAVYAAALAEP